MSKSVVLNTLVLALENFWKESGTTYSPFIQFIWNKWAPSAGSYQVGGILTGTRLKRGEHKFFLPRLPCITHFAVQVSCSFLIRSDELKLQYMLWELVFWEHVCEFKIEPTAKDTLIMGRKRDYRGVSSFLKSLGYHLKTVIKTNKLKNIIKHCEKRFWTV